MIATVFFIIVSIKVEPAMLGTMIGYTILCFLSSIMQYIVCLALSSNVENTYYTRLATTKLAKIECPEDDNEQNNKKADV